LNAVLVEAAVEFFFVDAKPRSETHQSGSEESAEEQDDRNSGDMFGESPHGGAIARIGGLHETGESIKGEGSPKGFQKGTPGNSL
jgi:hypothetical protein